MDLRKSRGVLSRALLRQPDSLKLTCSLAVLRHLHRVAGEVEERYGDKSAEKTYFISGVQGKISKPNWTRDYTYFLAKVDEVRSHLLHCCVQSSLDDLLRTALDIYNRFDNRRRMGVELTVLSMLTTKNATAFDVPDKYHSATFVFEMLVSCRHRFQKPEKCYFWSRQSETLLTSTFAQTRHLTRLKLAVANDHLLRALAVHCRQLQELELQFALDVTEEGLCSLAGKSVLRRDQGNARAWPSARCLSKDFGPPKEWFVKDCLLFTPIPIHNTTTTTSQDNSSRDDSDDVGTTSGLAGGKMPKFYDTGFGCLGLTKLRINGDFVFPPLARRYARLPIASGGKTLRGPVLEYGFYALLLSLPRLQRITMHGLPMVIARFAKQCHNKPLPLQTLTLDRDLLNSDEMEALARVCGDVGELHNVTPDCSSEDVNDEMAQANLLGGAAATVSSVGRTPHFSAGVCRFLKRFRRLKYLQGRMPLACFDSFLFAGGGATLTKVHLVTTVVHVGDLLLLRRFSPNLETLEGKFVVVAATNQTPEAAGAEEGAVLPEHHHHHYHHNNLVTTSPSLSSSSSQRSHFQLHRDEFGSDAAADHQRCSSSHLGHFSQDLLDLLSRHPMPKLTCVDVEGSLSILALQILAGNVEFLEDLHVTNSSSSGSSGDVLSDEWLDALVFVNRLTSIKNLTLRTDNEQTVESGGAFTERGLHRLLDHCLEHCPKMTNLVGEFTRIPDRTLRTRERFYAGKGLRRLRVRSAVPYRRFENAYETERHYAVNEGYHALVQEQQMQQQQFFHHQQQQQQQQDVAAEQAQPQQQGSNGGKRFSGYVFRPYPRQAVCSSSSDEDSEDQS